MGLLQWANNRSGHRESQTAQREVTVKRWSDGYREGPEGAAKITDMQRT